MAVQGHSAPTAAPARGGGRWIRFDVGLRGIVVKSQYSNAFFAARHRKTVHSAESILSVVMDAIPPVNSVVDFGCGVGTWLSVAQKRGCETVQGFDGPWVDQELLEVKREEFTVVDFERPVPLERKYDLAMTLEVAEHLSDTAAVPFVESLIAAADHVLFSAAIPLQGGTGHINEQWPEYWAKLFNDRGYVTLDFIRPAVWDDSQIPPWYRQNAMMFVRESCAAAVKIPASGLMTPQTASDGSPAMPMRLVHPDLFRLKAEVHPITVECRRLAKRAARQLIGRPGY